MNEIYIVIQMAEYDIEVLDVWSNREDAQAEFDEIAEENQLRLWDQQDLRLEMEGTIAAAGDEVSSVQLIRRTIHGQ